MEMISLQLSLLQFPDEQSATEMAEILVKMGHTTIVPFAHALCPLFHCLPEGGVGQYTYFPIDIYNNTTMYVCFLL